MQKSGLEVSFTYVSESNLQSLLSLIEKKLAQAKRAVLSILQQLVNLFMKLGPLRLRCPAKNYFVHTGQVITGVFVILEVIVNYWNICV